MAVGQQWDSRAVTITVVLLVLVAIAYLPMSITATASTSKPDLPDPDNLRLGQYCTNFDFAKFRAVSQGAGLGWDTHIIKKPCHSSSTCTCWCPQLLPACLMVSDQHISVTRPSPF